MPSKEHISSPVISGDQIIDAGNDGKYSFENEFCVQYEIMMRCYLYSIARDMNVCVCSADTVNSSLCWFSILDDNMVKQ